LRIPQGEVFHKYCLREDVSGIGPLLQELPQKLSGLGVFLLWRGAPYALRKRRKKLAFVWSHFYLYRLTFIVKEMDIARALHNGTSPAQPSPAQS
jgi:hypothetical protein